ncbi:MAG: class I SAM-dependent methyltransferase [Caldilineaceae bacterium]|nr:class I SAM-dependent methyltransferase [Caldilineaceae bacterium]
MEGMIAKWYAKIRTQDEEMARSLQQVRDMLPAGGSVLEIAPGPGYLAIEIAKLSGYRVVGLDISRTFVEIAHAKAREAGVTVDFQLGNASAMPFEDNTFDFTVCRAAFKNFTEPVQAIREMYRVLKPGGKALIADLRRDASRAEVDAHVDTMGLGRVNEWLTKWTFRTTLLKNAYTAEEMRRMVAQTEFGTCDIDLDTIGMEIWLTK